ncbi:MAG: outer membrane PBP1 activator LpoA protein [Gammaproteobacteria bacterium]|jgi:outer membrane PBP1 activator LpoA protein
MLHNIPMRLLIILLFSLGLLTACGPTKQSTPQIQVDPEENARTLMQSGDYSAAALEYLSLATKDKQNSTIYRLKAAAAYVEAGDYGAAQKTLNDTTVADNDSLQNIRMKILSARLELEFGLPGKALGLLDELSEPNIPQSLRVTFHDIRAKAYLAHGDYLKAASERLLLSNYLNTPTEIDQNNRSLWNVLESIPASDIDDLRIAAPDELTSWFELASLYQTYRYQPARLNNAIDGWVQRYPGHPAYSSIAQELIGKSKQFVNRPAKIGLLLPLSGKFQKSSTAIRDGFLAAWYMDGLEKSDIEIYDANSLNIIDVYQQAVNDGVDYVVGPLEKEAINQLANQGDLPIQVLALNRQDSNYRDLNKEQTNDKLIQFGLSPEDEAAQVAEIAMSDGHRLALVMTPGNSWGDRIAEAFISRWIELGGGVLERAIFQSNSKDFGSPVKTLLNIDSSEKRGRDLRNKLNIKINNVERRREDADFIFTAAVPGDAHQLFPQFRFHRAGDLPVYSTSHIFTGIFDEARDIDLNDVMFIDMPWILDTSRQLSIIQDALNRNWSQERSQYRRLYALGIDAYHLIPEIGRLSAEKNTFLSGETGDLSITPENIIKRKLQRAQFVEGKPVLLN